MSAELLPDAGPCRQVGCGDGQWSHKRGRFGCREVGCGCDKYLPPPAGTVEADPASPVPGVVEQRPDDADPGQPEGGFEPAQPGDVLLPCGTESARRRHLAHGQECAVCDPSLAQVMAEPEPVDEPEPDPVPVVADPVAQAEYVRQVAAICVVLILVFWETS